MKLFKFPRYIKKTFILSFFIILFVFIINSLGICQIQKRNMAGNSQEKAELTEDNSVNVVPYTVGSTEAASKASETRGTKLDQTVAGLKEAGYSLDEIVIILKNDNNDAFVVSIACLKQGFSGDRIYKSLVKSGFSENSAKLAVPLSIRQEEQFFGITTNLNETMSIATLENTSGDVDVKTNKNDQVSVVAPAEVLEVPVSVGGVKFNGLSNWNAFQDDRFNVEVK